MFPEKKFEDLNVGDSIFIANPAALLGWRFVCHIPQGVAELWVVEYFRESYISKKGIKPSTNPMKDWEPGVGIIVAATTAMFDEERLNLLLKAAREDFRLFLSEQVRPKKAVK